MDEQQRPGPAEPTTPVEPDAVPPVPPMAPEAPPAPRKRGWRGGLGIATAIVLAFVWGGIADRQFTPARSVARILPAGNVSAAVLGEGSPPQWMSDFASAFCTGDAKTIAPRIGPPLTNNVEAIANALSDRDWTCSDIRFSGGGRNPKGSFYLYVSRDGQNAEQWWVFTVVGDQVIGID